MVGPLILFDQMKSAEFVTGQGIDIRPHLHIGLATVTYLYKGKLHHRDSLGADQWIEPGAVNLMTAGHGVTHSERVDEDMIKAPYSLFGIQTWIALPETKEEMPAEFVHAPKDTLPFMQGAGKEVRRSWATLGAKRRRSKHPPRCSMRMPRSSPEPRSRSLTITRIGGVCGVWIRDHRRPDLRARSDDGVSPQRPRQHDGPRPRRSGDAIGRRNARRPAPHLVEFRGLQPGKNRRRERGLARRRLGAWPFSTPTHGQFGIHSAA